MLMAGRGQRRHHPRRWHDPRADDPRAGLLGPPRPIGAGSCSQCSSPWCFDRLVPAGRRQPHRWPTSDYLVVPLTSQFAAARGPRRRDTHPAHRRGGGHRLPWPASGTSVPRGSCWPGAVAAAADRAARGGPARLGGRPARGRWRRARRAAWVLVPALMRVRLGIDEVVTTLLLNPVALLLVDALLHGPWRDPETGFPESPRIAAYRRICPDLVGKSRLHLGFARWRWSSSWSPGRCWRRTGAGLRIRAVGLSPHAARFAGIERWSGRCCGVALLVSGAIAGIAGVGEVAGIQHRLTSGISSGFGYTGIVVAMLGGLAMPGRAPRGPAAGRSRRRRRLRSASRCTSHPRWVRWSRARCCW